MVSILSGLLLISLIITYNYNQHEVLHTFLRDNINIKYHDNEIITVNNTTAIYEKSNQRIFQDIHYGQGVRRITTYHH